MFDPASSRIHLPDVRSFPEPGRSLGARVVQHAEAVRRAVFALTFTRVAEPFVEAFDATPMGVGADPEPHHLRAKWFVVGCAVVHYLVTYEDRPNIKKALQWLFGARGAGDSIAQLTPESLEQAQADLSKIACHEVIAALLPYLFEPQGHVTRANAERCEVARETRSNKRKEGVYYTPSDVADFMVSAAAESRSTENWLDPACGTGVFLRSIFKHLRSSVLNLNAQSLLSRIYGIDKSALATDLASFVLLYEALACTPEPQFRRDPYQLWLAIKRHLLCADSLALLESDLKSAWLTDLLDGLDGGEPLTVVMNPPYGKSRVRREELHVSFMELFISLCRGGGGGAAVLPLAIGANTSAQYARARMRLLSTGQSTFLFFDREPQALFGEDIKTRNAILFYDGSVTPPSVYTSRMLKWTAAQRPSIFRTDRATPVNPSLCRQFVPKLGTSLEVEAYARLRSCCRSAELLRTAPKLSRTTLSSAAELNDVDKESTLLIGSTAYNFLNCFLASGLPDDTRHFSQSPVHAYAFPTPQAARAALALLSSRLVFWLWYVEGDGFHVTSEFLKRLPVWLALGKGGELEFLGEDLWREAKGNRWRSLNAGRETYSFRIDFESETAKTVENILLRSTGLPSAFQIALRTAVESIISIDGTVRAAAHRNRN